MFRRTQPIITGMTSVAAQLPFTFALAAPHDSVTRHHHLPLYHRSEARSLASDSLTHSPSNTLPTQPHPLLLPQLTPIRLFLILLHQQIDLCVPIVIGFGRVWAGVGRGGGDGWAGGGEVGGGGEGVGEDGEVVGLGHGGGKGRGLGDCERVILGVGIVRLLTSLVGIDRNRYRGLSQSVYV